jgi:hypothetical protein
VTSLGAVRVFLYLVVTLPPSGGEEGGERETGNRFNRIVVIIFQVEIKERDAVSSAITR